MNQGQVAKRRLAALVGAGALLVGVVSGVAGAADHIDLTTLGATHTDTNGGLWIQGGTGSGTGNFDPFLTYKTSADTEEAVNVCDDAGCPAAQFDTTSVSSGNTHELKASAIPVTVVDGKAYREFSLDANDTGADDYMSIDDVEIYLSSNKNLGNYPAGYASLVPIYSMPDDTDVLMRSQALSPGSGVSDITLLVPTERFGAECYYGSQTCDQYVFFHTTSGNAGEVGDQDYNVTAGFEEWRVSLQPVVDVQKTVAPSFQRAYDWTVTKTVSDEAVGLFNGDSAQVTWEIGWDRGAGTDSGWAVTGNISIENPTGPGYAISQAIPAVIVEKPSDVISIGASHPAATVSCPVAFPYTLPAGETLTCTYAASLASGAGGSNTASATIEIDDEGNTFDYTDTQPIDFSGVDPTEVDASAAVTDTRNGLDEDVTSDGSTSYPETFGCADDGGAHSNTATIIEADTGRTTSSTATATVTCYGLTVDKTVETSLSRDYTWSVDKSVSPTAIDMFAGDSEADVDWTITPTRHGPTDSGWSVTGTITITNPAPMAAEDVAVSDLIEHATLADVNAAVDCSSDPGAQATVDVPANDSVDCTYQAILLNGDDRTNTATATLFDVDYSSDPKDVDFSTATVDETNESATVTDPTVGVDAAAVSGTPIMVDGGASCPADAGTHENTATVTPNDGGPADTATASYTVSCYALTVSKDAQTTFTRDYDWTIQKSRFLLTGETDADNDLATLTLAEGQVYTANYSIRVSQGSHTDGDWAVSGTITVSNPAPIDADGVAVSDLVSPDVAALVDCDPNTLGNQSTVDVPANDSADCAYAADLADASARTNVATATLNAIDYDSAPVSVTFDATPDVQVDECIDVTDDNGTPADTTDDSDLGTVCLGDLDGNGQKTLTTTIDIGPYAGCETDQIVNTATFVTADDANDTDEHGSSAYTVNVAVPCPQGCTLTQGYWKTHNDSFKGGAPTDETWELIGPLKEGETFFLSGQTYFGVMWTAPKGNAYYILADQYIAAVLNGLNDAAIPANVQAAIDDARALFNTSTPAQIAGLKGKNGKDLRSQFIALAGTLASYNEGAIGPGHCDEDGSSAPAIFLPLGLLAPLVSRLRRRRIA